MVLALLLVLVLVSVLGVGFSLGVCAIVSVNSTVSVRVWINLYQLEVGRRDIVGGNDLVPRCGVRRRKYRRLE